MVYWDNFSSCLTLLYIIKLFQFGFAVQCAHIGLRLFCTRFVYNDVGLVTWYSIPCNRLHYIADDYELLLLLLLQILSCPLDKSQSTAVVTLAKTMENNQSKEYMKNKIE